mgnify:CR=1 FL=1
MGISCRMFLLDHDDGLYRLPSAKFNQMLRDPTSCRLTRFAGARVRMTNVAVELLDRQPIRVVWNTFGFLAFDDEGYFDSGTCLLYTSDAAAERSSVALGGRRIIKKKHNSKPELSTFTSEYQHQPRTLYDQAS